MVSLKKWAAAAAASCALVAGSLAPAAAQDSVASLESGSATPSIIGGSVASSPWVVQLRYNQAGMVGVRTCTGQQLDSRWILTAKHCVAGSYNMHVYHSNSVTNPGGATTAARLYSAPAGDIALIRLDAPVQLRSYASLNMNYRPGFGQAGTIMGYGNGAWSSPTNHLRSAAVRVNGTNVDLYGGAAAQVNGVTGAANHGDSGGPLIVGGRVVGVCSKGDTNDPGANINAGSQYALLNQASAWIQRTTGLNFAGTFSDGRDTQLN